MVEKKEVKEKPKEEKKVELKKVEEVKKEEIKETKPEPVEAPKEELNMADVINNIYTQLKAVGEEIGRINQQLETMKLNQLYIQQLAENALKATEVKE